VRLHNSTGHSSISGHRMEVSSGSSIALTTRRDSALVQILRRFGISFSDAYAFCIAHRLTVPICSLCIGLISAYDSYLTIKYFASLKALEINPVGRWMMGLDSGPIDGVSHIALFLGCKFAGTVIVLFVLQMIWFWRRRWSGVIALKVALFQLALLLMLLFWPYH